MQFLVEAESLPNRQDQVIHRSATAPHQYSPPNDPINIRFLAEQNRIVTHPYFIVNEDELVNLTPDPEVRKVILDRLLGCVARGNAYHEENGNITETSFTATTCVDTDISDSGDEPTIAVAHSLDINPQSIRILSENPLDTRWNMWSVTLNDVLHWTIDGKAPTINDETVNSNPIPDILCLDYGSACENIRRTNIEEYLNNPSVVFALVGKPESNPNGETTIIILGQINGQPESIIGNIERTPSSLFPESGTELIEMEIRQVAEKTIQGSLKGASGGPLVAIDPNTGEITVLAVLSGEQLYTNDVVSKLYFTTLPTNGFPQKETAKKNTQTVTLEDKSGNEFRITVPKESSVSQALNTEIIAVKTTSSANATSAVYWKLPESAKYVRIPSSDVLIEYNRNSELSSNEELQKAIDFLSSISCSNIAKYFPKPVESIPLSVCIKSKNEEADSPIFSWEVGYYGEYKLIIDERFFATLSDEEKKYVFAQFLISTAIEFLGNEAEQAAQIDFFASLLSGLDPFMIQSIKEINGAHMEHETTIQSPYNYEYIKERAFLSWLGTIIRSKELLSEEDFSLLPITRKTMSKQVLIEMTKPVTQRDVMEAFIWDTLKQKIGLPPEVDTPIGFIWLDALKNTAREISFESEGTQAIKIEEGGYQMVKVDLAARLGPVRLNISRTSGSNDIFFWGGLEDGNDVVMMAQEGIAVTTIEDGMIIAKGPTKLVFNVRK